MKINNVIRFVLSACLLCGMAVNTVMAQIGERYAAPVFDEVDVTTGITYSSAIREGETSPTTLYLDFYEPHGDTLDERPLVITVFGGAFVAGSRDFVDMQEYCTRLAKHGYAAASIDYRLLSIWNLSRTGLVRTGYMAAQDLSSAVRFFKAYAEEYRIDTSRVFLLGNSAGSLAILCNLFMNEDERPAETFEEPDLGSLHSSGFDEYAGFSPAVAGAIPHWGGVLDCDLISIEEYVPLCMIHGTEDTTVPYDSGYCYSSQLSGLMPFMYGSHPIANRLDDLGISDYEFHPFEGEEHAFYLTPFYQLDEEKFDTCFSITRDFLYNHLNGSNSLVADEMPQIQVFPNPASDVVVVCFEETLSEKLVTVIDVMGRLVVEKKVLGSMHEIDVSQWPSGIYFLLTEHDGQRITRKLLKR